MCVCVGGGGGGVGTHLGFGGLALGSVCGCSVSEVVSSLFRLFFRSRVAAGEKLGVLHSSLHMEKHTARLGQI